MSVRWSWDAGRQLREAREQQGWTQARLADAVGCTPSRISEVEKGKCGRISPPSEQLYRRLRQQLPGLPDQPEASEPTAGVDETRQKPRLEKRRPSKCGAVESDRRRVAMPIEQSAAWTAYPDAFEDRLRWPASPSTVADSLPVLFFGDVHSARTATVGLNPSPFEYVDESGRELEGGDRRFESLNSLAAPDRSRLSSSHVDRAIHRMITYFDQKSTVYEAWFGHLIRFLSGCGLSFRKRTSVHLDLAQEATCPAWQRLKRTKPVEHQTLLERDSAFLKWQLNAFTFDTIFCNGRSVYKEVARLLGVESNPAETRETHLLSWWIVPLADARVVVGWNRPLDKPTGLSEPEERAFGHKVRRAIDRIRSIRARSET